MAGNAVKRATEALVKAAQQAKDATDDSMSLTVDKRKVGGIAQVRKETLSFVLTLIFINYSAIRLYQHPLRRNFYVAIRKC